jgi:hypothetical protein
VTGCTAHSNGRMDCLAFCLVFMTLGTGCGILFRIEGDRVYSSPSRCTEYACQNRD